MYIRIHRTLLLVAALAAALPAAAASASAAGESAPALDRFEARWGPLMRNVFGMSEASIARFRSDHANLSTATLDSAARAPSWEAATLALKGQVAPKSKAREQYPNAVALFDLRPEDASNALIAAAYKAAPKTVGPSVPARFLFQPLESPCTVFDTRYATNPDSAGLMADGSTRRFNVRSGGGPGGQWDFTAQGGAPTCTPGGGIPSATPNAVLLTVYVSDATANGWVTFYRADTTDPSTATISVYYSPGPTRTQTVFTSIAIPYITNPYDVAVTARYGSANVAASLVGYYIRIPNEPLACFAGPVVSQALSTAGDSAFSINGSNGCVAGTTYTSLSCGATGDITNVHLSQVDVASGTCSGVHYGTGAATVTATPWCCRMAGEPY